MLGFNIFLDMKGFDMLSKFSKLRALIRDYKNKKDAAVLPVLALLLPVILGMTALGVDAGYWVMHQRNLQTAADAAAMAAAYEIANGSEDNAEFAATKEAMVNGYDPTNGDVLTLDVTEDDDGNPSVAIEIEYTDEAWFSRYFVDGVDSAVAAGAVADQSGGNFCMFALDEEADNAFSTSGSVTINASACGLASNSSSEDSMTFNGSVEINVDNIRTAGDYDLIGSAELNTNSIKTGAGRINDPYEDLDVPETTPCTRDEIRDALSISSVDEITLSPGRYCGGINISGTNTVTFEPGVYVLDGGDFNVSGSGALYGDEVSFILTNTGEGDYGNIDVTGNVFIDFTAPLEGDDMEGVLFYQDRSAPEGNGANMKNKITGSSEILLDGAVYTPSREMTIGGSASADSPCSRIIAKTIVLSGTPAIGNNCDDSAAADIGGVAVRLTY